MSNKRMKETVSSETSRTDTDTDTNKSKTWRTLSSWGEKGGGATGSSSFSSSSGRGSRSRTSGSRSRSQNSCESPNAKINRRNIGFGRILLLVVLLSSAGVLGYAAYALMQSAEIRLARDRFIAIAQRAEANAEWVIGQKKQAADSLAIIYGAANPDAEKWPFVYMDGYTEIAQSLRLITSGSLSFAPIIEEIGGKMQQDFQDFYYDLYENKWGYPNGTGVSAFGEGIFGYGTGEFGEVWPDYRYPAVSNWTRHGIPNNILVPFVQSDFGPHSSLMLDVNFKVKRATTIQTLSSLY